MNGNNAIASISFVNIPYGLIADSTVKVSDKEIKMIILLLP